LVINPFCSDFCSGKTKIPPKLWMFAILNPKLKHCLSRMAGGQLIIGALNLLSSKLKCNNLYFTNLEEII